MYDGLVILFGTSWMLVLSMAAVARYRAMKSAPDPDLELVLLTAVSDAAHRGQSRVTSRHVLLSLSFDPVVAESVARVGALESLRESLDAAIGRTQAALENTSATFDAEVAALGQLARERAGRRPTPIDVFDTIVEAPPGDLRDILAAAGLAGDGWRGGERAERGARAAAPVPYRGAEEPPPSVALRIWNDEETTMAFVLDLLTSTFGCSATEAHYLMLRTHRTGSAIIGRFSPDEAVRLAEAVEARARTERYPLRVTTETPGAKEERSLLASLLGVSRASPRPGSPAPRGAPARSPRRPP